MNKKNKKPVSSQFSARMPITSCYVTKELILHIENYLLSRLSEKVKEENRELIKKGLFVEIIDSLGRETISSILDYRFPRFDDGVTEIEIGYKTSYSSFSNMPYFSCRICFSKNKYASSMRFVYEGENSRDFLSSLIAGIREQINIQSNKNSFFHPSSYFGGIIFAVFVSLLSVSVSTFFTDARISIIFLLLSVLLGFYGFVAPHLKPYVTFDSKKNDLLQSQWKYWVVGILSFFIFSTILPKIRDELIKLGTNRFEENTMIVPKHIKTK